MYYCAIFKCHSYKAVESYIGTYLSNFRDKRDSQKEMMRMHYTDFHDFVEFIIENHNRSAEFINEHAARYVRNSIELAPVIPEPVTFEDAIVVRRESDGGSQVLHKIDVSDWSEEKIQELVKKLLNSFVAQKESLNNYDFTTATQKKLIKWKEFKDILTQQYSGKNLTQWREIVKTILTGIKQLSIGWRG